MQKQFTKRFGDMQNTVNTILPVDSENKVTHSISVYVSSLHRATASGRKSKE
jgi:hypothetical protein